VWNTDGMAQAIIMTVFWVVSAIAAIGGLVAGITLIRTGGDNYQK